ncbi:unnamed protein product [Clavelina lepadiformis]|uniref:Uncharacterized protein n=1 Tax=Clavelina lepadiformis TaxID=159417 RepID=A0ABP0FJS3_CLALP
MFCTRRHCPRSISKDCRQIVGRGSASNGGMCKTCSKRNIEQVKWIAAQKRKEDQWDPIRSGSGARFISSNQQGRSTFGSAVIGGAFPALVESLRFTSSHSKLKFLNLGLHSLRILEVFQLRGVPLLSFR